MGLRLWSCSAATSCPELRFSECDPKEALVCRPDGQVLCCVAILWGCKSKLSCKFSPQYPVKEKKCPSPPTDLQVPPQCKIVSVGLAKSQIPVLGAILWVRRESVSEQGHSECETLRGYSLGLGRSAQCLPVGWVGIISNGRLF